MTVVAAKGIKVAGLFSNLFYVHFNESINLLSVDLFHLAFLWNIV